MRRTVILFTAVLLFIPLQTSADRLTLAEVAPVIYNGVKYTAPQDKMGYVEAYDVATGKKLWEKKIYNVIINPLLEEDVQWVFIKEMKIEHDKGWDTLVLVDERDREYEIVIKGRKDDLAAEEKAVLTFHYEIDDQGGKYFFLNESPEGRRFDELIAQVDNNNIQKLELVPNRKSKWHNSFREERNRLVDIARKNRYVLEIKGICPDKWTCPDGMTSDIYDYQDKDVDMKTSKETYSIGEKVSFAVINRAGYAKYFQVVRAEHLIDGKWKEVLRNVPCGCGICEMVGHVESGTQETWEWDQMVFDNAYACVKAGPGQYRFVIENLYGYPDENGCKDINSTIYSNVFEIKD